MATISFDTSVCLFAEDKVRNHNGVQERDNSARAENSHSLTRCPSKDTFLSVHTSREFLMIEMISSVSTKWPHVELRGRVTAGNKRAWIP